MFEVLSSAEEKYPGYAEAVARENLIRGAACLGWRENICGCEVLPLTAFHVRRLSYARTPFLAKLTAEELCADEQRHDWLLHHIMVFLWTVSPMFSENGNARPSPRRWWESQSRYARRCPAPREQFNRAFAPILKKSLTEVCREILTYVEEAYLDAGEDVGNGDDKSYYAFEHGIAEELHANYPKIWRRDFWNEMPITENPLHVALKNVWQMRRTRMRAKGEVVTNASEKLISIGLALLGERRRKLAEYENALRTQPVPTGGERYPGGDIFDYGVN